jgi:hypothetical protein
VDAKQATVETYTGEPGVLEGFRFLFSALLCFVCVCVFVLCKEWINYMSTLSWSYG